MVGVVAITLSRSSVQADEQVFRQLESVAELKREQCALSERESQPSLNDQSTSLAEITTVLETIGHILISDENYDLAGHNPSWFMDAANVLERMAHGQAR